MAPYDSLDHPLFDDEDWPEPEDIKPSKFYLRRTPAAPLSIGTRAVLGILGLAVAAVLVLAVLHRIGRGPQARPSASVPQELEPDHLSILAAPPGPTRAA